MNDESQPLISHLIELRSRLLKMISCVVIIFLVLLIFSNSIYQFIASPLVAQLPAGSKMIAIDVTSPFLTPIKLTFFIALFVSVPFLLYQIWQFIAPALYARERRLVLPLLVSSTLLFYVGMAFAYFVVLPLAFYFFVHTTPENVAMMTDINQYLSFVMVLFLAFGMSFEVPVLIVMLCWTGVTTPKDLKQKRPYIIVIAFIIGMLLTPPDVLSQTLLAIPICILFEIGVFFARFYVLKNEKSEEK